MLDWNSHKTVINLAWIDNDELEIGFICQYVVVSHFFVHWYPSFHFWLALQIQQLCWLLTDLDFIRLQKEH